jgi:hypothetical protein
LASMVTFWLHVEEHNGVIEMEIDEAILKIMTTKSVEFFGENDDEDNIDISVATDGNN